MERAAKERLIGAVVLVTAAWLLIPVFLDQRPERDVDVVSRDLALPERAAQGDGAPAMRRETIDLRPEARPQTQPDAGDAQISALPAPSAATDSAAQRAQAQPATDDKPAAQPAADASQSGPDGENPPAQQQAAVPDEPAEAQAIEPKQSVTATRDEAPAKDTSDSGAAKPAAAGGQLWAVQLGSFSDEANAQRLAAKYRGEGLPAFISEVKQGGRTLHRVRIGPQASRADAESILKRLVADGQAASVVVHP